MEMIIKISLYATPLHSFTCIFMRLIWNGSLMKDKHLTCAKLETHRSHAFLLVLLPLLLFVEISFDEEFLSNTHLVLALSSYAISPR
jgi:hypothetical protein